MGVDRNIHLGPYIRVIYEKKTVKNDSCRTPSNCPNSESSFCPKCGMDKDKRFSLYVSSREFYSMFGNSEPLATIDDPCESEDGAHMIADLAPNTLTPRDFSGEDDVDSEVFNIEEEKTWMEEKFAKEIGILNDKFDEENVEVRWGYFTWWS